MLTLVYADMNPLNPFPFKVPNVFCGVNNCPYALYNWTRKGKVKIVKQENPNFRNKGFKSELHCCVHYAMEHLTEERYEEVKDTGDMKSIPMTKMNRKYLEDNVETARTMEFTTNCTQLELHQVHHLTACKVSNPALTQRATGSRFAGQQAY